MLIFNISILLTLGVVLSTIMNKARIPDVLAYITVGVILGPSLLNIFDAEEIKALHIINEFALCMVGFLVCKSLNIKQLKKTNFTAVYVSIIESVVTFVIVFAVCFFIFQRETEFCILLAAISSATAPIIPIIVLRQFKAEGDLSSAIVPIIAIDNFICVCLFYFALALSKSFSGEAAFGTYLSEYFLWILISAAAGVAFGAVCSFLFKYMLKSKEERLIFNVGICFACVGLAYAFDFQPLVLSMGIGFAVANLTKEYEDVFEGLYLFAPPVFLLFFAVSSSVIMVDIYYLLNIGIIGIAYILSRTAGKIIGCYVGAKIFKYKEVTKKYLGLSILAQAGIILFMSDIVEAEIPVIGESIAVIVRGGCVIFLTIGPLLTKFSIRKANEIKN